MRHWGYLLIAAAILFGSFYYSDAACTPNGTLTTNFNLCKPQQGETGWSAVVNANFDTIDANLTNSFPRSYLAGLGLTNTAAATATKVDIAPGQAQDAGNVGTLSLSSTLTKDLSAVWSVGTNGGCLGNGVALSASTVYHIYVIKRTDTSVVDAYCDTSVSAGNIPTPYTLFRRIGSIKTDASSNILQFIQTGDWFTWNVAALDYLATNPGTSATTITLTVPTGVKVDAVMNVNLKIGGGVTTDALLSDLAIAAATPARTVSPLEQLSNDNLNSTVSAQVRMQTNTLGQIRGQLSASDAAVVLRIATTGYFDPRGKNN